MPVEVHRFDSQVLRGIGVEPHFEEFVDTHVNLGYRYDCSIPLLTRALL